MSDDVWDPMLDDGEDEEGEEPTPTNEGDERW